MFADHVQVQLGASASAGRVSGQPDPLGSAGGGGAEGDRSQKRKSKKSVIRNVLT